MNCPTRLAEVFVAVSVIQEWQNEQLERAHRLARRQGLYMTDGRFPGDF